MSNIHGLRSLLDLRTAGRKPAEAILLTFSDSEGQARFVTTYTDSEGVVRSSDNIDTLDLRPLIGLEVIVCVQAFGERENRFFLRLQQYAADVILLVTDWATQSTSELGLRWTRGGETQTYPGAAR